MIETVCWLLPASRLKNWLLRLFGHQIHSTSHIGPNLVMGVDKFEVEENVRIGPFNVFRKVRLVRLNRYSIIESWNWVSAHPVYRKFDENAGTLFLGTCSKLGSRCYVDCSGTIILKAFANVGGNKCFLQTHEPDFTTDQQSVGRITVGHHSFVGSGAILLKGAVLPDESLLGANSTLIRADGDPRKGLYAGSPAVWKRETKGDWFSRNTYYMSGYIVDEPLGIRPDDLEDEGEQVVVDTDVQNELAEFKSSIFRK